MSYLVTARRCRPQTFESIDGQEHVTRALANAILREKIPHALLFTGPRGVGKTSCARVFSKALNCLQRGQGSDGVVVAGSIEPCGNCVNCLEIAKSTSMAVREIDGASHNSVDNVRELIESLRSLPPPGSRFKIYIIDEVHMLSTAAFNALLKSLEEPPPNTIFVFATTEPHKIPETVISRCQRHDFRALSTQLIASQLRQTAEIDKLEIDEAAVQLIARKAQGGMRDAQSMFDRVAVLSEGRVELGTTRQVLGLIDSEYYFRLTEAIITHDTDECFSRLDQAFSQSLDIRAFVADFLRHWRALLVLSLSKNKKEESHFADFLEMTVDELRMAVKLAAELAAFDVQRLFDLAERTAQQALESNFPRYVFEAGVAKMATLSSLRSLGEILERLEGAVGTGVGERAVKKVPSASERVEAASKITFNPSWQDFVNFAQSRSKVVLASHLRRVNPSTFRRGELVIEASSFDVEALKDHELSQSFQECLEAYSGEKSWAIKLRKHEAAEVEVSKSEKRPETAPIDGSLAQFEASERRERKARIDQEARESSLVQSALETFSGSKIDKISVIE